MNFMRNLETENNIRAVFPNKTNVEVQKLKKAIALKTSPIYRAKAKIFEKYIGGKSIEKCKNRHSKYVF